MNIVELIYSIVFLIAILIVLPLIIKIRKDNSLRNEQLHNLSKITFFRYFPRRKVVIGGNKKQKFLEFIGNIRIEDQHRLMVSVEELIAKKAQSRLIELDFQFAPDSYGRVRFEMRRTKNFLGSDYISILQQDVQSIVVLEEALRSNFLIHSAQRELMPEAILAIDSQGLILDINDQFHQIWDLEAHELRLGDKIFGHNLFLSKINQLLIPEDKIKLLHLFTQGSSNLKNLEIKFLDGRHYKIIRGDLTMADAENGSLFFFNDESSKAFTQNKLNSAQYALDHLQAPIEWFNRDGIIVYANSLADAFFSSSLDDTILGHHLYDIHPFLKSHSLEKMWERLVHEKSLALELEQNGNTYECFLNYFHDGEHDFCFNYIRDITLKKRQNNELQKMAFKDQITGMPNLRNFVKQFDIINSENPNRVFGIVLFDIDHFKTINDVFHHRVGDELLRLVGERISSLVDPALPIARIAGDEFIFLIEINSGLAQLKSKLIEIHEVLNLPFYLRGQEFVITSSFGVSIYPHDSQAWDDLYSFADIAMYKAKHGGRNQIQYFNLEMKEALLRTHQVTLHLNHALERDELYLVHQAQINLSDNRLSGFETLIRWKSADLGSVSPQYFINIAESNGMIIPIGEWALRKSCLHAAQFNQKFNSSITVSVNVSALQFKTPHFVAQILHILKDTGLAPKLLELEITESVIINDMELVVDMLRELRTHGIRIAVDDFGTGYSSLHYLQKLPLDKLKIDKAFIDTMLVDDEAQTVVKIILDLSKRLGLKVVAEGVENLDQLNFLKEQNCDLVQGFFYTSGLDYESFMKFLSNFEAEQGPLGIAVSPTHAKI